MGEPNKLSYFFCLKGIMKKIFVALFILFTLVACGTPVTGVVIEKDYDPGYSKKYTDTEKYWCGTETYYTGYGKDRKHQSKSKYCKRNVEKTKQIPADWDITVRNEETGQEHEINVTQWDFNAYREGDKYPKATR